MLDSGKSPAPGMWGTTRTLAEMDRDYALAVLKSVGGNRTRAAKVLGIGTTTLWRKLKEWGEAV
jgi:two-component system response regulator HydG